MLKDGSTDICSLAETENFLFSLHSGSFYYNKNIYIVLTKRMYTILGS